MTRYSPLIGVRIFKINSIIMVSITNSGGGNWREACLTSCASVSIDENKYQMRLLMSGQVCNTVKPVLVVAQHFLQDSYLTCRSLFTGTSYKADFSSSSSHNVEASLKQTDSICGALTGNHHICPLK
jgi:hypothetical protein